MYSSGDTRVMIIWVSKIMKPVKKIVCNWDIDHEKMTYKKRGLLQKLQKLCAWLRRQQTWTWSFQVPKSIMLTIICRKTIRKSKEICSVISISMICYSSAYPAPQEEKSRLVWKVYAVNPTTTLAVRKNAFRTISES